MIEDKEERKKIIKELLDKQDAEYLDDDSDEKTRTLDSDENVNSADEKGAGDH